jgi:DNA-binding GntR family transcriptional regulator
MPPSPPAQPAQVTPIIQGSATEKHLQSKEVAMQQTLADRVYDRVREMILGGELLYREQISIRALSEQLRTGSYTPVRDALKRLEAEGMVQIFPQSHTEVTWDGQWT